VLFARARKLTAVTVPRPAEPMNVTGTGVGGGRHTDSSLRFPRSHRERISSATRTCSRGRGDVYASSSSHPPVSRFFALNYVLG
jgi:hypothetical protein